MRKTDLKLSRQRSETEEILDSILPPREWEEDGQLWRQSVSSTPATRLDVINLQVYPPYFKYINLLCYRYMLHQLDIFQK